MATISNLVVNLIARTSAFVNNMRKAKGAVDDFKGSSMSIRRLGMTMQMAGAVYLAGRIAEGFTDAHKAMREGQSALVAFTEAIPILGQTEKAFAGLLAEVSGLAEKLEGLEAYSKSSTLFDAIRKSQSQTIQSNRLEAMGFSKDQIAAQRRYLDQIEDIDKIERGMREAKRKNPELVLPDFGGYKTRALQIFNMEMQTLSRTLADQAWAKYNKHIQEVIDKINLTRQSFAAGVIEKIKTPIERYAEYIDKLSESLNDGYLSWEQYAKAVKLAQSELQGGGFARPGAGVAEAINLGQVSTSGLSMNSQDKSLLEETQMQTQILKRIEQKTGGDIA